MDIWADFKKSTGHENLQPYAGATYAPGCFQMVACTRDGEGEEQWYHLGSIVDTRDAEGHFLPGEYEMYLYRYVPDYGHVLAYRLGDTPHGLEYDDYTTCVEDITYEPPCTLDECGGEWPVTLVKAGTEYGMWVWLTYVAPVLTNLGIEWTDYMSLPDPEA